MLAGQCWPGDADLALLTRQCRPPALVFPPAPPAHMAYRKASKYHQKCPARIASAVNSTVNARHPSAAGIAGNAGLAMLAHQCWLARLAWTMLPYHAGLAMLTWSCWPGHAGLSMLTGRCRPATRVFPSARPCIPARPPGQKNQQTNKPINQ